MSSHTNYQQRIPQNQVRERSQPIQNWNGDRSFQQNRISQGNSRGFQNEGFNSNSWLIPGKNGRLQQQPIQNQKRSLFIASHNTKGQRSCEDTGLERRGRDSSMRRRRVR